MVASRQIDEELVLLPIRTSVDDPVNVHALNPVGAFLWARLDGTRDETALASDVVAEFEVDEPTARADVRAFLAELERAGLVEGT